MEQVHGIVNKPQLTCFLSFNHKKYTQKFPKIKVLADISSSLSRSAKCVSSTTLSTWKNKRKKKLASLIFTTAYKTILVSIAEQCIHQFNPVWAGLALAPHCCHQWACLSLSPPLHASGPPHCIPAHTDSHVLYIRLWQQTFIKRENWGKRNHFDCTADIVMNQNWLLIGEASL